MRVVGNSLYVSMGVLWHGAAMIQIYDLGDLLSGSKEKPKMVGEIKTGKPVMQFDVKDNVVYTAEMWAGVWRYTQETGGSWKREQFLRRAGNMMYVTEHNNYVFVGCSNEGTYRISIADGKMEHVDRQPCRALLRLENGVAALSTDSTLRRWNG